MVEVPRPLIRAPNALRKRPKSTISGSRAAPWIRVPPRASTAALSTFAVPVTVGPRGPLMSMVAPRRRRARPITQPRSSRKSAPRAANPFRCRSTGRSPMRQPPGRGTMARPRRASSGPSTQKLARIRRTNCQRRADRPPIGRFQPQRAVAPGNVEPQVLQHAGQRADVGQLRHALQPHRLGGQDRGGHHRQRGVLRSVGPDLALKRHAAGDAKARKTSRQRTGRQALRLRPRSQFSSCYPEAHASGSIPLCYPEAHASGSVTARDAGRSPPARDAPGPSPSAPTPNAPRRPRSRRPHRESSG